VLEYEKDSLQTKVNNREIDNFTELMHDIEESQPHLQKVLIRHLQESQAS